MNETEEAAIRARVDAATPGPWTAAPWSPGDPHDRIVVANGDDWLINVGPLVSEEPTPENPQEYADAAFIAHARADVPALLAEVSRLRSESEARGRRVEELERELGAATREVSDVR